MSTLTIDLPTVRHYTIYNNMDDKIKKILVILIEKLGYYGTISFLQTDFQIGQKKAEILADIAMVLPR